MKNPLKKFSSFVFNVIFAVRENFKLNSNDECCHCKQTKNKSKDSESVQVRSLFECSSFEFSRSDCPLLFSKNFITMRESKGNRAKSAKQSRTTVPETTPSPEVEQIWVEAAERLDKHALAYVDEMIKLRSEIDKMKEEMYLLKRQTFTILVDHLEAERSKS